MMRKKRLVYLTIYLAMALCAVGIFCSAYVLYTDKQEYEKGGDSYRQAKVLLEQSAPANTTSSNARDTQNSISAPNNQPADIENIGAQARYDFAPLTEINSDIAGWITSSDTEINYPIVQAEDNSYYMRRLFNGERNKLGSIFIDYRNDRRFNDKNTVIYGHNMNDGSMFSSITNYGNQKYYDDHPRISIFTPAGDFTVELFAGMEIDSSYDRIKFDFTDGAQFSEYIASLKKSSDFTSGIEITHQDRIVTLCTCSNDDNDARYALYGKLTTVSY